jgi:type IV pilus assembly protein PilQ
MGKNILSALLLILLSSQLLNAQELTFEGNLNVLEKRLDFLADSLLPGLNETANFSVVNTPVQELLRGIAETHSLNVSVDPALQARITNNFTNVKVKDLLFFLCKEYHLDINFINTILSFQSFQKPLVQEPYVPKKLKIFYNQGADRITIDLKQDSLSAFARQITQHTNKNVIVAPHVQERFMNGFIADMPFDQALSRMAFMNKLELEKSEDNFFILTNLDDSSVPELGPSQRDSRISRTNTRGTSRKREIYEPNNQVNLFLEPVYKGGDTLITLEAVNVPIKDVIQEVSLAMNKDYIFFSEPQGSTVSRVENLTYDELLQFLLHGTSHTFQKQEKVYLVGERNLEGFRTSKLVKFQFRTITDIEKVIPVEIAKGVQITPFKELNAIILSGGSARIAEIEAFLKSIDEPVPNIMIEVIVVEVRKGVSLQTGLSAVLGDSTVSTQGKVFPGVDMTISSQSANRVLDRLEDSGIVNLGRVRPNFYLSLKALEQDDNIKIRSTPKLSTLNGHEAELSIGQSVYYLEQTQNVTGGVNPIITSAQRFNKVDAALEIKIVPVVSGDEHVTLDIMAQFSDFIPPQIKNAPPGNATRRFVSQIRVKNGEMIILGGLEEARQENQSSGLPVLSRIPVLKWIFSQRNTAKRDDKLVVFIRPQIVF